MWWPFPYLSSLTLKRESHASRHQITLSRSPPIILTLTQKSTNWKISLSIIKLPKQNWFAKYRNSDPLAICFKCISVTSAYLSQNGIRNNKLNGARIFNCGWTRQSCKKRHKKLSQAVVYNIIQNFIPRRVWRYQRGNQNL
jgi:hypothetical protein